MHILLPLRLFLLTGKLFSKWVSIFKSGFSTIKLLFKYLSRIFSYTEFVYCLAASDLLSSIIRIFSLSLVLVLVVAGDSFLIERLRTLSSVTVVADEFESVLAFRLLLTLISLVIMDISFISWVNALSTWWLFFKR